MESIVGAPGGRRERDARWVSKGAAAFLAVIAISLPLLGVAQSASAASWQCIPQSQDFIDEWGNRQIWNYLGGTYSGGHVYYSFHHYTPPFDNGIVSCQAY